VRNADGSRDIYTTGIAGQNFTAEHDVIGASGATTLIDRYFADGTLAFTRNSMATARSFRQVTMRSAISRSSQSTTPTAPSIN